jgi:hypothetical protein
VLLESPGEVRARAPFTKRPDAEDKLGIVTEHDTSGKHMTLTELDRLARDLQALLATATERVDDFATEVSAARAQPDPFASLYFAARKSYRRACDTANKSGKNIERVLISTYRKAMDLGFKGSIRDWEALLRICLPQ